MTATIMSRSRVKVALRRIGWAGAAVFAVLAPKCMACLMAYAGLGAALGLTIRGAELCGAAPAFPLGAAAWLAAVGAVASCVLLRRLSRRRRRASHA